MLTVRVASRWQHCVNRMCSLQRLSARDRTDTSRLRNGIWIVNNCIYKTRKDTASDSNRIPLEEIHELRPDLKTSSKATSRPISVLPSSALNLNYMMQCSIVLKQNYIVVLNSIIGSHTIALKPAYLTSCKVCYQYLK